MSPDLVAALIGAALVAGSFLLSRLLDAGVRLFRRWLDTTPHFIGR